jgi:hypothetical protein
MNRMEVEARSDECIDYQDGGTTVSMKNAVSLGGLQHCFRLLALLHASTSPARTPLRRDR